ncbi:cellulose biosynthesis protein BcsN (plasmid) [Aquamicrobium terrae]
MVKTRAEPLPYVTYTSCLRGVALSVLAVVVAACAQPNRLERSSLTESLPAQQALVLPPPGGPAVVGVIERRYSNAIQQDVVLAAETAVPGQNLLRIQAFGPVGSGGTTALVDRHLSGAAIGREMRGLLPGVAMRRSALYAQNAYGPFGYATGRHGKSDLCLYAWQRIAASQANAPLGSRGTIQIRLRVCRAGATEQALLAIMHGYTINASFAGSGWNPYGPPSPADPRLGRTGQPIHSAGPPVPQASDDPEPAPAPVRRSPTPVAAPVLQTLPAPPAGAPTVPPPPAAAAGEDITVPAPPAE